MPTEPSNFIAVRLGRQGEPDMDGALVPLAVNPSTGALLIEQRQAREAAVSKISDGVTVGALYVLVNDNPSRKGYKLWNDHASEDLYVRESNDVPCTTDNWSFKVAAGTMYECYTLCYTGKISGIFTTAAGNVRVTDLS